jgi:hypothetical protein
VYYYSSDMIKLYLKLHSIIKLHFLWNVIPMCFYGILIVPNIKYGRMMHQRVAVRTQNLKAFLLYIIPSRLVSSFFFIKYFLCPGIHGYDVRIIVVLWKTRLFCIILYINKYSFYIHFTENYVHILIYLYIYPILSYKSYK